MAEATVEESSYGRMDPAWKAKWIEALESGKYKQGQRCLRSTDDQFCCLGVLCDVVDPQGWHNIGHWISFNYKKPGDFISYPPAPVCDLVKLSNAAMEYVAWMNDARGFPFAGQKSIAQWIRENL